MLPFWLFVISLFSAKWKMKNSSEQLLNMFILWFVPEIASHLYKDLPKSNAPNIVILMQDIRGDMTIKVELSIPTIIKKT